jgi:hypothetical protein
VGVPSTSAFDLAVDDLIEAAHARAGGAQGSAWELDSARRALNLLFQTITNRGVNLWQMELATLPLLLNTVTYTLPADTVDIWRDAVVRDTSQTSASDLPMVRIGYDTYLMLSNKDTSGRPTQWMLERRLPPVLRVYQPPDKATYLMTYWRIRMPRDAISFADNVDYAARWQPALVSGLAYFISMERRAQISIEDRAELKAQWEDDYNEAASQEIDKTDLVFSADLSYYSRI